MQLFPCPFCGLRGEAEFRYGGEAGNHRPALDASDTAWSQYLHFRTNEKGPSAEIWMHLTCGEFFRMDRDTVTHAVAGSVAIAAGEAPAGEGEGA